jgi:hypothetical protein
MPFHPSRKNLIYSNKSGFRHNSSGGSILIKPLTNLSIEDNKSSPAFIGNNVKPKINVVDPAKAIKSYPLSSGSRESNGNTPIITDKSHIGGLMTIRFNNSKKNDKVKLKI